MINEKELSILSERCKAKPPNRTAAIRCIMGGQAYRGSNTGLEETSELQKNPEIFLDHQLNESMIGYIVARNAISDFKKFGEFLDVDEVSHFLEMTADDSKKVNTIEELMQIHDSTLARVISGTPSGNMLTNGQLKQFQTILKVDYVMNMNETITDRIDFEGHHGKGTQYLRIKLAESYANIRPAIIEGVKEFKNLNMTIGSEKYLGKLDEFYEIFQGMRHESAFKQIIRSLPDKSFEIIETDKLHDAHGIDFFLKARISKKRKPNGEYQFANTKEIISDEYIDKVIPIDLKSNKDTARKRLGENVMYWRINKIIPDNWVMYSHIEDDDFRRCINDSGDSGLLDGKVDTPVFISSEDGKQISAMKMSKNGKISRYDQIIDNIKDDYIRGLMYIESERTRLSQARADK